MRSPDRKHYDGFICEGWRKVFKGGYVRFAKDKHYHETLKDYENEWLYVSLNESFGQSVEVWLDHPWQGKMIIARPI